MPAPAGERKPCGAVGDQFRRPPRVATTGTPAAMPRLPHPNGSHEGTSRTSTTRAPSGCPLSRRELHGVGEPSPLQPPEPVTDARCRNRLSCPGRRPSRRAQPRIRNPLTDSGHDPDRIVLALQGVIDPRPRALAAFAGVRRGAAGRVNGRRRQAEEHRRLRRTNGPNLRRVNSS
jgi:hypothetical protein